MSPGRRVLGVVLLIIGILALITPFTPGSWLIFVAAEILGIEFLCRRNVTAFIARQARWFMPIVCIATPFLAGAIGSFYTIPSLPTWYASLIQPSWTPPNWIFAPVWTSLYLLMGIAALLVWRAPHREGKRFALKVFFLQLAANTAWSYVFFGLHATTAAFVIIMVLWMLIIVLITRFARLSRTAAWLLAPYLLWVTYAATLNLGVVLLN